MFGDKKLDLRSTKFKNNYTKMESGQLNAGNEYVQNIRKLQKNQQFNTSRSKLFGNPVFENFSQDELESIYSFIKNIDPMFLDDEVDPNLKINNMISYIKNHAMESFKERKCIYYIRNIVDNNFDSLNQTNVNEACNFLIFRMQTKELFVT